jgi:hypothetical protein
VSAVSGIDSEAVRSLSALLDTATIRERCRNVLDAVEAGGVAHFRVDRSRLDAAAARVEAVTRRRYPDLDIPYHSRWRHFEAGGVDRAAELSRALGVRSVEDAARARIELTMISVLLDAGAGRNWGYREAATRQRYTRSEGLGVATFRAFLDGAFSSDPHDPLRVDASKLILFGAADLALVFQADAANPLVGLDGRAALLRRLGRALMLEFRVFGTTGRPAGLFDALTRGEPRAISARNLLRALLESLRGIWLTGSTIDGVALGDAWRHPHAGGSGPTAGWVPFHKLSQWLAYSLFEPFEWAGRNIADKDALTGLPEYRNGGLLLDTGVLALNDPDDAKRTHDAGSELVVEWRALTVALLDELAGLVRVRLQQPDLPLACILEGGTWAAGREIAKEKRNGDPPLAIRSDGTVF